jgi:hypothetical protein
MEDEEVLSAVCDTLNLRLAIVENESIKVKAESKKGRALMLATSMNALLWTGGRVSLKSEKFTISEA